MKCRIIICFDRFATNKCIKSFIVCIPVAWYSRIMLHVIVGTCVRVWKWHWSKHKYQLFFCFGSNTNRAKCFNKNTKAGSSRRRIEARASWHCIYSDNCTACYRTSQSGMESHSSSHPNHSYICTWFAFRFFFALFLANASSVFVNAMHCVCVWH